MESLKGMCHCSVNKEMRLYHEIRNKHFRETLRLNAAYIASKPPTLEIQRSPPRSKHRETLRQNAAYIASKPNRSKSNAHLARSPLSIRNIYLFSGHSVSFSSNAFCAVPSNIPFPN